MAAAMGTAMLVWVGCGDNNSANQSDSTNVNDLIKNNPVTDMTNSPVITNDVLTNLPATTNRLADH